MPDIVTEATTSTSATESDTESQGRTHARLIAWMDRIIVMLVIAIALTISLPICRAIFDAREAHTASQGLTAPDNGDYVRPVPAHRPAAHAHGDSYTFNVASHITPTGA